MAKNTSVLSSDSAAYYAQHDSLTGLPNRLLLHERLGQALALAHRHNNHVALLSLNLDNFKAVNDSLRHITGNYALQRVASFLTSCVRATDTVFLISDDEFIILLTELEQPEDAAKVAEKVLAAVNESLEADEHDLHITMSIASSVFPDDGETVDELLQHAEEAMHYRQLVEPEKEPEVEEAPDDSSYYMGLLRALNNEEFVLHYQPQFDLESGSVIGVETFVRWQNPEQGLVYPHQFMPVAEESGLIVPIGEWVLRETCKQVGAWKAAGMLPLPFSVNVSADEFRQLEFAEEVAAALQEANLERGDIELEIPESVVMEDVDQAQTTLNALKAVGVRLAMDGFGAGTSSLRYLKELPFDTIKVDRFFLLDVDSNPDDAVFFRSLIRLGKSLDCRIIVTGVENLQQLEFLQEQKCDVAQGFQLGRPQPADDLAMLLASRGSLMPAHHQLH